MTKTRWLLALALVAAAGSFYALDLGQYFSISYFKSQQAGIEAYYQANPIQTIALFFAVYVAATALSFPGAAVLTLAAGALFGLAAGTLIVSFASSIHGFGLNKILGTIRIYPTLAESNKYVAGVWKRNHAPQRLLTWLERYHGWRRGGNASQKAAAQKNLRRRSGGTSMEKLIAFALWILVSTSALAAATMTP